MWRPLVIVALIATHAQAGFAPGILRWEGAYDRSFILAPESALRNSLAPRKSSILPEKLSIWDEAAGMSHNVIPRFTANRDKTISSAEGLCLEAGDDTTGNVRLNHCTGRPNQLWSFLPSGDGRLNQIRLEVANKCIGIDVHDGSLNGAPVQLRECANQMTEAWKLEEPTPIWTQRPLQPSAISSIMRHMMLSVIALAGLGAVAARGWLWKWQRNARSMAISQNSAPLITIQGGVPATKVLSLEQEADKNGQPIQGERVVARTSQPEMNVVAGLRAVRTESEAELWERSKPNSLDKNRRKGNPFDTDEELDGEGQWLKEKAERIANQEPIPIPQIEEEDKLAYADYLNLLQDETDQIQDFSEDSIVTGTVSSWQKNGLCIDIGCKSLAFLPNRNILMGAEELPAIGEKIRVHVIQDMDMDGRVIVSARKVQFEEAWDKLGAMLEANVVVEAQVIDANRGGVEVIVKGVEGFCPRSHLSTAVRNDGDDDDLTFLVGRTLPCKILDIDNEEKKVRVSNRVAVTEKLMENIQEGSVIEGRVEAVQPFGVFVDVGGTSGLLHISQISTIHIVNVEEVLPVGTLVKALIMKYDKATTKFSLSTKVLEPTPGDMITNPQKVFDMAEETAALYNKAVEAERKARQEFALAVLYGSDEFSPEINNLFGSATDVYSRALRARSGV